MSAADDHPYGREGSGGVDDRQGAPRQAGPCCRADSPPPELNPAAGTLRSDAPVSMKPAAQFYGPAEQRERWTLLVDSVRTGNAVVAALRGKESFEYIAEQPELAELFNQTMTRAPQPAPKPRCCWSNWSSPPTTVTSRENGRIWRCC